MGGQLFGIRRGGVKIGEKDLKKRAFLAKNGQNLAILGGGVKIWPKGGGGELGTQLHAGYTLVGGGGGAPPHNRPPPPTTASSPYPLTMPLTRHFWLPLTCPLQKIFPLTKNFPPDFTKIA